MEKCRIAPLSLLLLSVFIAGCAKETHTYLTPDGKKVETSAIGLQTMAIRDQNTAIAASYSDGMQGASDIQAVALMADKLTARNQSIEREATTSEEARAWAALLLRYFGGGVDVLNKKHTDVKSEVYNINGNNNNMAGIKNKATSQQGDVTQSLVSESTPTETNQTWQQEATTGSANGESNPVSTDTTTDFGIDGGQ